MSGRARRAERGAGRCWPRPAAWPCALLVACAGTLGAHPAPALAAGKASIARPGLAAQPLDPLAITGRDFAGMRLPSPVTPGVVEFSAQRATVWTQPGTGAFPVQRLLLSGDVRVQIGLFEFSAARAVVWLQRLDEPAEPLDENAPPADVFQVFAYLDRAGTPTADPAIGLSGDRLAVQGIIALERPVSLLADLRIDGEPRPDPFVREGERKLATYLRRLLTGEGEIGDAAEAPGTSRPRRPTGPIEPGLSRPGEPVDESVFVDRVRDMEDRFPVIERPAPIFARTGVFSFSAGEVSAVAGDDEQSVILTGGVVGQYWDRAADRTLQLSAERAVVFLEPGPVEGTSFSAERVRGVYLEGDVVADGETDAGHYVVRAPKIYYDVQNDRALMIDAVFWTYDQRRGMPLYVRAKSIRQEAADRYKASDAVLSNTAFAEPHVSIGATSVTLTRVRRRDAEGSTRNIVDARNITLRAGPVPFFYWPIFRGDPTRIPLRGLSYVDSTTMGAGFRSAWDAFSLLGIEAPEALRANLLVEYYSKRGWAGGLDAEWLDEDFEGSLFAYGVPDDEGTDRLAGGGRISRDGEFRGMLLAEHRADLDEHWQVFAELTSISDENFVDVYFDQMARHRREFTSGLTLQRTDAASVLRATARARLNDFIANEYLLQSPGFSVDRLPEITYVRLADDLFGGDEPGLVTYFSEYRLGRIAMNFSEPTASELGFNRPRALEALGLDLDQSIADRLEGAGLDDSPVLRFDTRHEISMPLSYGPLNVTPFAVGRATVYDEDFEEYSSGADEPYRLFGAVGTTFATEIQKIDNNVESRLFDLHRIRHIVAPSLTVWYADSTIEGGDLPPFDPEVEGIADGATTRFAIDQTWQTQRGGPGRWRSVDVFKLSAAAVWSSDEMDEESPIGRFLDYRPELSNPGDYLSLGGTWLVTEIFAVTGETVYDFDLHQAARSSAGVLLQHTPDFQTFAEVRYLNAEDSTILLFGADVRLTEKYNVNGYGTYDSDVDDFQTFSGELRRRFPNLVLGLGVSYNNITDESGFGLSLQPVGITETGARLRGLGMRNAENTGVGF